MKVVRVLQMAAMLTVASASMAAEVKYQHPELTIVAQQEPLDSVLKSLGREMRIFVTVPTGFNPVVNCDIQNQSIKQALRTLLGDTSYSLEWEKGGDKLVGLTIFGAGARDAQVADERAAMEEKMAEEREEHEAEMEMRRQEEAIAHAARMKEEIERHDAETKAYLESQGIELPE